MALGRERNTQKTPGHDRVSSTCHPVHEGNCGDRARKAVSRLSPSHGKVLAQVVNDHQL